MAIKPRDRILEAAARLLYQEGIESVAVHRIIAEADVAPMTLYRQFGGKDALVAAALDYWSRNWFDWLRERIAGGHNLPESSFGCFWNALDEWLRTDEFRGSFIENAASALRSSPRHPAWEVIHAHRSTLRQLLEDLAEGAGALDPVAAADQLQLLTDGAVTVAMVDRRPTAAASVRMLADRVIATTAA